METTRKVSAHSELETWQTISEAYNGTVTPSTVTSRRVSWFNQTNGEKNPRWKEQVKLNLDATTPFTGFELAIQPYPLSAEAFYNYKPGVYIYPWNIVYQRISGTYIGPVPTISSAHALPESLANSRALSSYLKAVLKARRSFNGATTLAESAEAIRLIRNPAMALRGGLTRYLGDVKKRHKRIGRLPRRKRRSESRKILAGTWLEYSFGWAPLISDLDDGIRTIAESGIVSRNYDLPVQGYGEEVYEISRKHHQISNGSFPKVEFEGSSIARVQVIYSGKVDTGTFSALNPRRVGFAPSDWVPALWEIVPYSFLVDYFTNVGEIISALSTYNTGISWTRKTVIRSISNKNVLVRVLANPSIWTDESTSAERGSSSSYAKTVERDSYSGSLVPRLTFSMPGSGLRWMNIAALGLQSKGVSKFISKLLA